MNHLEVLSKAKHICIANIAGAGMSAIAGALKVKMQKHVVGFDGASSTPFTYALHQHDIPIKTKFHASMLPSENSVLITSSATPHNDPAILHAHAQKIPIIHRAQALAAILQSTPSVCVAGCHGKSTTSTLIFESRINTPSPFAILTGAIINRINANFSMPENSVQIVAECDESDGTLTTYKSHISVITNVDTDHMEQHHTIDHLYKEFATFAANTSKNGCMIINGDDPRLVKQTQAAHPNVITYGIQDHNDYQVVNCATTPHSINFDAFFQKKPLLTNITLPLPLDFNATNALPAIILAHKSNLPLDMVRQNLQNFQGLDRRMSYLTNSTQAPTIINDYAHHPTSIKKLILGLISCKNKQNFILIFQPHRIERLCFHFQNFINAIQMAPESIILPVYAPTHAKSERIKHARNLAKSIQETGSKCNFIESFELLEQFLLSRKVQNTTALIFCNAGDLSLFAQDFTAKHYAKFMEKHAPTPCRKDKV